MNYPISVFLTEGRALFFCRDRLVSHSTETFITGNLLPVFYIPFWDSINKYCIKCLLELNTVLSVAYLSSYHFTLEPLKL